LEEEWMSSTTNTLIVGGQARLPKELSTEEVFQVVVEVERDTHKVLEASFSPCLPVIEKMLRALMIGVRLDTEAMNILETLEQGLYHRNKRAIMTAIKDLVREYKEYQFQASKDPRGL
jgi:hypothetical protein